MNLRFRNRFERDCVRGRRDGTERERGGLEGWTDRSPAARAKGPKKEGVLSNQLDQPSAGEAASQRARPT